MGDSAPVEFSAPFVAQLAELVDRDPGLAGRLIEQIEHQLPFWEPGLEDRSLIRHVKRISKECRYPVYRLKDPRAIGKLRVFFFELNRTRARLRFVATMLERGSDDETYDDPKQPHCQLIRDLISEEERGGRLSSRR